MDINSYKTKSVKPSEVKKSWVVVDADSQVLGRLASNIATIVRGKNKTLYTPHVDCGDHVIVVNADKIKLTGKKWDEKIYLSYSGYPGGQKETTPRRLKEKSASKIIERAVKGMLPKNRLGRKLFKNLHVYNGADHPHEAVKPKEIKF